MLDYDQEAERYDATRGGEARAEAAARAIRALLPAGQGSAARQAGAAGELSVADVGCGTGIVTVRLLEPGRRVLGIEQSAGMAAVAAARLGNQDSNLESSDPESDVLPDYTIPHRVRKARVERARALRPSRV